MNSFSIYLEKNALSDDTLRSYLAKRDAQFNEGTVPRHKIVSGTIGRARATIKLSDRETAEALKKIREVRSSNQELLKSYQDIQGRLDKAKESMKPINVIRPVAKGALALAGTAAAAYGAKKLYDRYKKNKQQEKDSAA